MRGTVTAHVRFSCRCAPRGHHFPSEAGWFICYCFAETSYQIPKSELGQADGERRGADAAPEGNALLDEGQAAKGTAK